MQAVPNEYLEMYLPIRVDKYETIPDSGGEGRFRGGNAMRIDYVFLEPGTISIHDDRWLTKPWGVHGGGKYSAPQVQSESHHMCIQEPEAGLLKYSFGILRIFRVLQESVCSPR
ncbi:hypothetical protein DL96DRAFT_326062 [Flagelloscypha sp. PMI_526]|nr:hypothetical protein DL96DRAFT_326062 [Flagelloscypha sp. PMI_526]